jgi:hypothetical protein
MSAVHNYAIVTASYWGFTLPQPCATNFANCAN